ncbi:MAG: hypothetical protein QOJ31_15 [Gaiellales bacterium]|jgi:uncharacterized RDD family membrane protein YckC|nr:hypothetical protein [Gaiellales bacterium]MDX6544818.1 hypothetical protein [Gaiellales bacterium]MDX6549331.1 hypothetical protein [Gaiellales bacterium]
MYCRNCGTEHPDTAQFCPSCGVGTAAGGVATEYAGFWRRVAAYLVDALILAIPNIILSRIGGAGSLAVIVVDWIYFAYQESSPAQATIGKRALGIKVTNTEGNAISFGRATGRYFAKILSVLTLLIGVIMIAFTSKKQGLHDMIASTLVVKTK